MLEISIKSQIHTNPNSVTVTWNKFKKTNDACNVTFLNLPTCSDLSFLAVCSINSTAASLMSSSQICRTNWGLTTTELTSEWSGTVWKSIFILEWSDLEVWVFWECKYYKHVLGGILDLVKHCKHFMSIQLVSGKHFRRHITMDPNVLWHQCLKGSPVLPQQWCLWGPLGHRWIFFNNSRFTVFTVKVPKFRE